jgi:DNA repair ATPase RecN
MNSKLTNIEIKNNSLETRFTEIERKMVSMNEIQGALDTLNSKVSVIDNILNTAAKEFKELESNVSALGNVFDSIREVSKNNKSLTNSNKKEILKTIMDRRRLEERVENEQKAVNEVSDNVKKSLTDLKARSLRDNLIYSGFPEETSRLYYRIFFTKEIQT